MSGRNHWLWMIPLLAACGGGDGGAGALGGTVTSDGSSTVAPITEAMAEEFGLQTGGTVSVTVATSGTGGGFTRFCAGEIAIANASRPITPNERDECMAANVTFLELPIALDGIAVVVNPANDFAECLTIDELKAMWQSGSQVRNWSDVRASFPAEPIQLYGPGTSSGTFDYFTERVVGAAGASRANYTASEDDNVLVQGVGGDAHALAYFGLAYYTANQDRLKVLAVDAGQGCVTPTEQNVKNGRYPLARPLFIYVNEADLRRPEVAEFVRYYNLFAAELIPQVGYVPLDAGEYEANLSRLPAPDAT